MTKETADLVLACIGITLGLCTLLGMFAKFVALPWFRDHVVNPVKETNHQVTINGHISRDPTLLDKVDNLQTDITTAARMFEGHIERSGTEWNRVWRKLDDLADDLDARTRPTHPKEPPS